MHTYIHTFLHTYIHTHCLKTIETIRKTVKCYSKAEALFLEICKYLLIFNYFQKL